MFSREERSGLVVVLVGGGVLVVVLLLFLGFFSQPEKPRVPSTAEAAAGATARAVGIKLGSVAGRVVDARTGLGLASCTVDVEGLEARSDHWLVAPDPEQPGRFEIRGLPPESDFLLRLTAAGHVATRREVRVAAGSTTMLEEIRLTPLVTLAGLVVDSAGAPVPDAEIELALATDAPRAALTTHADAHGAFHAEALAPGEWQAAAHTAAGERSVAPLAIAAVEGGEHRGLWIEVFPTVVLRGVLRAPPGEARPTRVRADGRTAAVAPDGSFTLEGLFAGPMRLVATLPDGRGIAWSVDAPGELLLDFDPQAAAPAAEPTEPPEPALVTRRDPVTITTDGPLPGTLILGVVDEAGRALAGARVELPLPDGTLLTRFTNRSGECILRDLPEGAFAGLAVRHGTRRLEGAITFDIGAGRTTELPGLRCVEPPPADPTAEGDGA